MRLKPSEITWDSMIGDLPAMLPELREACAAEVAYWADEDPPRHVLYGDVLNPHIERLLDSWDEAGLKRAFDLLEVLARSSDVRVQEVAAVTICEHHLEDVRFRRAKHLMGPATVAVLAELDDFWDALEADRFWWQRILSWIRRRSAGLR